VSGGGLALSRPLSLRRGGPGARSFAAVSLLPGSASPSSAGCAICCHGRQTLQELQRLEDQLSRAVVPRRLQLERDAAIVPQPQALLREGRTQDIPDQALQPRSIVRRHPHVGVQVEALQVRLTRPARGHALEINVPPGA
jgi:hypothetical protein